VKGIVFRKAIEIEVWGSPEEMKDKDAIDAIAAKTLQEEVGAADMHLYEVDDVTQWSEHRTVVRYRVIPQD